MDRGGRCLEQASSCGGQWRMPSFQKRKCLAPLSTSIGEWRLSRIHSTCAPSLNPAVAHQSSSSCLNFFNRLTTGCNYILTWFHRDLNGCRRGPNPPLGGSVPSGHTHKKVIAGGGGGVTPFVTHGQTEVFPVNGFHGNYLPRHIKQRFDYGIYYWLKTPISLLFYVTVTSNIFLYFTHYLVLTLLGDCT